MSTSDGDFNAKRNLDRANETNARTFDLTNEIFRTRSAEAARCVIQKRVDAEKASADAIDKVNRDYWKKPQE